MSRQIERVKSKGRSLQSQLALEGTDIEACGRALEAIPLSPSRWNEVLLLVLRQHNWAHGTRPKTVAFKTMQERRLLLYSFFRELRALKYWIDPRSLKPRHIETMVQVWLQRGLAPATLQRYVSHLRVFCDWIHKPGMVPSFDQLGVAPELVARTYSAVRDHGWAPNGASPAEVIAAADGIDRYVGAQLRLQQAFGLRVKEALMIQPHSCMVDAQGAGLADPDASFHLRVKRGTKGGRLRFVPIDTDDKRRALAHAQSLVHGIDQSLADPSCTLLQAYHRFYYVMKQLGVTRAQLGITAHGLRHGYAADRYAAATGVAPPVQGGSIEDPKIDAKARMKVAAELGHGRPQIASAYVGGLRRASAPNPTSPTNPIDPH